MKITVMYLGYTRALYLQYLPYISVLYLYYICAYFCAILFLMKIFSISLNKFHERRLERRIKYWPTHQAIVVRVLK